MSQGGVLSSQGSRNLPPVPGLKMMLKFTYFLALLRIKEKNCSQTQIPTFLITSCQKTIQCSWLRGFSFLTYRKYKINLETGRTYPSVLVIFLASLGQKCVPDQHFSQHASYTGRLTMSTFADALTLHHSPGHRQRLRCKKILRPQGDNVS